MEGIAGPDVFLTDLNTREVVIATRTFSISRNRSWIIGGNARRCWLRERRLHRIKTQNGVVPRVVDSITRVVVVDGVGNQDHRAICVIENGEVGRQQHRQLRHPEFIGIRVRQSLPAAYRVVADHPNETAGERRKPLKHAIPMVGVQRGDGVAQRVQGVAGCRHANGRVSGPLRFAIDRCQHCRTVYADE